MPDDNPPLDPQLAEAIANYVRARRIDLGLTQAQAAARADVSIATWSLIERGSERPMRDATTAGIARALGWRPTWLADVFLGNEPTGLPGRAETTSFAEFIAADPNLDDDARELLRQLYGRLTSQERHSVQGQS